MPYIRVYGDREVGKFVCAGNSDWSLQVLEDSVFLGFLAEAVPLKAANYRSSMNTPISISSTMASPRESSTFKPAWKHKASSHEPDVFQFGRVQYIE